MPAISACPGRILPLPAALACAALTLALTMAPAAPAAAQDPPALRVGGGCGLSGRLVLERVQAERRSDGQWNYLLHIRNTGRRLVVFTLSLRALGRELARTDNQPYRVDGGGVLVVPTGPGPQPIPTAQVAEALRLECP